MLLGKVREIAIWKHKTQFELDVWSDAFGQEVKVTIYAPEGNVEKEINDVAVDSINVFLNIDKSTLEIIKNDMWRQYNIGVQVASYGVVPRGLVEKFKGNEELANRDYFGYQGPEDAFSAASIRELSVDGVLNATNYMLLIDVPWDEHDLIFSYSNSALVCGN